MGKKVKVCMEYIMCERCKGWEVFNEEECEFSFKEDRKKNMYVECVSKKWWLREKEKGEWNWMKYQMF